MSAYPRGRDLLAMSLCYLIVLALPLLLAYAPEIAAWAHRWLP